MRRAVAGSSPSEGSPELVDLRASLEVVNVATASVTLSPYKRQRLICNPASAYSQALPSTDVKQGDVIIFQNVSTTEGNKVTINASDTSNVWILAHKCVIGVVALQDTPTASTHWAILSDGSPWKVIEQKTATGSSVSIDFQDMIDARFSVITFHILGIRPSSASTFKIRLFDSTGLLTGAHYFWNLIARRTGDPGVATNAGSSTTFVTAANQSNLAQVGLSGDLSLYNPSGVVTEKTFTYRMVSYDGATGWGIWIGEGGWHPGSSPPAITGIRFYCDSNIAGGTIIATGLLA